VISIKYQTSLPRSYAGWLSDIDWKYFVTLHFKDGSKPSVEVATKAVKHLAIRLGAHLNGRRSKTKLSVFPVLEESSGGVPLVHILIGPENSRGRSIGEVHEVIADIWGKQDFCINPKVLGKANRGWFERVDDNKHDVLSYVCKEFKQGKDPVLVDAISLNTK